MRRLIPVLLAALAAALLALPAAAPAARTPVFVGIGDQNSGIFSLPAFSSLGLKKVRYFLPWDAQAHPGTVEAADAYVAAAKARGVRVLMHFSTDDYRLRKAKLPSLSKFRKTTLPLVRRFRSQGVREFGVWNEANHKSQPTYRNPKRAAQFFLALRRSCRGCTVVALDLLDQAGVARYVQRFYRALGRKRTLAKIVGIHNYGDTNRPARKGSGTRGIIRAVKRFNRRTQFWLTETGGIVKFGRAFPCSATKPARAEKRAARGLKTMFTLTRRFRRDVKRLYIYNFYGEDCRARFDAGLVRRDGKPRPGYRVVKKALKGFKK